MNIEKELLELIEKQMRLSSQMEEAGAMGGAALQEKTTVSEETKWQVKALIYEQEKKLLAEKKRYENFMRHSGVVLFDYLIQSDEIVFCGLPCKQSGLFSARKKVSEPASWAGVLHPGCIKELCRAFHTIKEGASSARAVISSIGEERETIFKVLLILSEDGESSCALGAMTDNTECSLLQSEKQYWQSMLTDQMLSYEANITRDTIISTSSLCRRSIGGRCFQSFSQMIGYMAKELIHPDDEAAFCRFFTPEQIEKSWFEGRVKERLQYRTLDETTNEYRWVRNTMNIIKDDATGELKICCFIKVIDEQKRREEKRRGEQRHYELMLAKSATTHEVNFTQDRFVSGMEDWPEQFGVQNTGVYSQMIAEFAKRAVYAEDTKAFLKAFSCENVIEAYFSNHQEITLEYRRPNAQGRTIWVSNTLYLFEDSDTGDLRGFCNTQDIDAQKRKELELIYRSEHDIMTELYNKCATASAISSYLEASDGQNGLHAFFIIDVDHFKNINDQFGHIFGDAVISELSRKLRHLFRSHDILGRVGGDEFVVLMKNISTEKSALSKAREICTELHANYTQNAISHKISASIGVALYPRDGKDYDALYAKSDLALYAAKDNGRNGFVLYSDTLKKGENREMEAERSNLTESRAFADNISEYVFRILYESSDKSAAIDSVLTLVGTYFNISRAYIFEDTPDGKYTCNTFEWCNQGIPSRKELCQKVPYSTLGNYRANFNEQGIFFVPDINIGTEPETRAVLERRDIISMLQYSLMKNGKFTGFIGFDECQNVHVYSGTQITTLENVANMIGTFLIEMRANAIGSAERSIAQSIVDALPNSAYVIDPNTYEMLLINEELRTSSQIKRPGGICHRVLRNRMKPCEDCPMNSLKINGQRKHTQNIFMECFNSVTTITASWIDWSEQKRACLINSVKLPCRSMEEQQTSR